MINRILPLLALLLVGCAGPSTDAVSSVSVANAPTPSAPKSVEAIPPTEIGDKSPIAFTHWKGVRKGTGSLTQAGKTTKLESFELELNPDGTMTLAPGEKTESAIKGSWRRKDDKTVDLEVPNAATGTLLFMDRANPYQLSLKGESLRLDFRVQE